jgi:predicted RNase H-like HicB family nuclease
MEDLVEVLDLVVEDLLMEEELEIHRLLAPHKVLMVEVQLTDTDLHQVEVELLL